MNSSTYNDALKPLERASEALGSAAYDLKGGFILTAVNRAYYSCYYCMSALLLTENVYAKTHQGVKAKFSELFIKTGLFPEHASEIIQRLFENRQEADYDFDTDITANEAAISVEKASDFFQMTQQYFDQLNADTNSS